MILSLILSDSLADSLADPLAGFSSRLRPLDSLTDSLADSRTRFARWTRSLGLLDGFAVNPLDSLTVHPRWSHWVSSLHSLSDSLAGFSY